MKLVLLTITVCFLATGCTIALQEPFEDHAIQSQVMADACRGTANASLNYPEAPCSPDLQADLDANAEQARCALAALRNEKCTPLEPGQ